MGHPTTTCAICSQSVRVGYLFKHLLKNHPTDVYALNMYPLTGCLTKKNHYVKICDSRTKLDNTLYCCFGCENGWKKIGYLDDHTTCKTKHLEKLKEFIDNNKSTPTDQPVAQDSGETERLKNKIKKLEKDIQYNEEEMERIPKMESILSILAKEFPMILQRKEELEDMSNEEIEAIDMKYQRGEV